MKGNVNAETNKKSSSIFCIVLSYIHVIIIELNFSARALLPLSLSMRSTLNISFLLIFFPSHFYIFTSPYYNFCSSIAIALS
jgi:hypothetical protein